MDFSEPNSQLEERMKNPARVVVMLGLLLCFAGLGQGYLNAQTTGPAGNVQTIWDLIDVKIGNTTTTINTTTNTDNNGMIVLPPNMINVGRTRTSEYYCRDNKIIAVENEGKKPKDVNCGGWIFMGNHTIGGGYGLNLNYGQNGGFTISEQHMNTGMGGGKTQTGTFPKYQVFGGFSYFMEPSSDTTENFVGFGTSFTYNPCKRFGIVGEFDYLGQVGVPEPPVGGTSESGNLFPFMGGVQFNYRQPKYTVFAQGLFGDVYARNTVTIHGSSGTITSTDSSNGFGMKLGGGVDYNLTPKIGVRLVDISYSLTDFSGSVRNNLIIQVGVNINWKY
jgi:hypothetical protein